VISQDIKVIEKKYYDKDTKVLSKYTTCDSNKTIRVVSDNMISTSSTAMLYQKLGMSGKKFSVSNVVNDGVKHFISKTAIDSSKNILYINISSYDVNEYVKDIVNTICKDKKFMKDFKSDKPISFYVNYFQVMAPDNQCEHIVITVIRENQENKYFYYHNKKY
jgi:hypothetical protein